MISRLARDSLVVFESGVGEVPGLMFYGLRRPEVSNLCEFPVNAWPHAKVTRNLHYYGEHWRVVGWQIVVDDWPAAGQLSDAVRSTLDALVAGGSRVTWVGAEGLPFCDPPEMLSPDCMSEGVLAWLTDVGDFGCLIDPDQPIDVATDEQMMLLRTHAAGLADAPD